MADHFRLALRDELRKAGRDRLAETMHAMMMRGVNLSAVSSSTYMAFPGLSEVDQAAAWRDAWEAERLRRMSEEKAAAD